MPIHLTRITSSSCELAKSYELQGGKAVGSAIAHMTAGQADVIEIADLSALPDTLDALTAHQAVTLGVPAVGSTPLTTRAGAEFRPDAVARTNEAFRYLPTPALFPIDVDTERDVYGTLDEVLDVLESASPWLAHVVRVARPSASSYVGGKGLRGVHIYIAVTRGTDIPALAQRLQIEQWAAGHGRIVISKSGALLVRQLSDATVYQPSRLMFEAPPVLGEGVSRDIPGGDSSLTRGVSLLGKAPGYQSDDGMLDAQKLPAVKDIDKRRFEVAVRSAKNAKRLEAKRVALDYHKANALAAGQENGDLLGALALRAMGDKVLPPSWPLAFEFNGKVEYGTVRDALGALDVVMGKRCADPFDSTRSDLGLSDLRAGEVCTMQGKPGVWSHKFTEFFAFGDHDAPELSHPLEVAAERLCGTIEEWPDRADKKRSSVSNLMFAVKLLCRDAPIALAHDVCRDDLHAEDLPPIGMWLDAVTRLGCSSVAPKSLSSALEIVSRTLPVDPWKDSILALPVWDKQARLDSLFTDLFGAPGSAAQAGATQVFFAGIVMRQLRPGAPCPIVPVLIGDQGVDKSLFVARICETMGWPSPTPVAFSHDERKMAMSAARSPVAELAEMSGLGKRDAEDVKRWVTDTADVYRTPYDTKEREHPRRYCLIGTGNKNELNRDETGNRRFMPVLCQHQAPPAWQVELPQILAEAKARFCGTFEQYIALIRSVSDMVKDHNAEQMAQGLGTVTTDLDELIPPILGKFVDERGAIGAAAIRQALDATPTGRRFDARAIASWLITRGWSVGKTSGLRVYRAPAGWSKPEPVGDNVVQLDPFARQG